MGVAATKNSGSFSINTQYHCSHALSVLSSHSLVMYLSPKPGSLRAPLPHYELTDTLIYMSIHHKPKTDKPTD